jgi:microsomal dipeptidase-like Zn-dependent dipeptidase
MPDALADVSRLPILFDALRAAGFSEPDLEKVAWTNWRRVL